MPTDDGFAWAVAIAVLPILGGWYFALLYAAAGALGRRIRGDLVEPLYVLFLGAAAATFATAGPIPEAALGPVAPATTVGAAFAGGTLYAVHDALRTRLRRRREPKSGASTSEAAAGSDGITRSGVAATLLAPVPEELLYRGGVAVVAPAVGPGAAVAWSALAFGGAHARNGSAEVARKTVDGAVYAVAFLWSGSVWLPVAMHAGYNLAALKKLRK